MTYRADEGAPDVRDHRPVKCQKSHTQPRLIPEQLIDHGVVGSDPADQLKIESAVKMYPGKKYHTKEQTNA